MALKTGKKKKAEKAPSKTEQMRKMRESSAKAAGGASVDKGELIVSDKTLDILPPLTDEQKRQKAVEDDKRFRELESSVRTNFVEMMFLLREFKAYALWGFVTNKQGKKFGSFDSWLKEAAPMSRASGYAALRAAEKLLPIIPKKDLEQMPRYSVELLAKMPKLKLESNIVKAAQSQSKKELTETLKKHAPEAHIEQVRKIAVDASAGSIIDQAFAAAVLLGEVPEAEALEFICTSWMDSLCELEQYQGMTNRQAYNAAVQAKNAESAGQVFQQGEAGEQAGADQAGEGPTAAA